MLQRWESSFSPGHDLSNDAYEVTQTGDSNTGATSATRDTIVTCGIPTTFGAGVTYVYDNRLTVGADVMFQNWSKVSYMNNDEAFLRPLEEYPLVQSICRILWEEVICLM